MLRFKKLTICNVAIVAVVFLTIYLMWRSSNFIVTKIAYTTTSRLVQETDLLRCRNTTLALDGNDRNGTLYVPFCRYDVYDWRRWGMDYGCLCFTRNEILLAKGRSVATVMDLVDVLVGTSTAEVNCAAVAKLGGRLGNVMGQYAALYALAKLNRRPAFMVPEMADALGKYFKVSIPIIENEVWKILDPLKTTVDLTARSETVATSLSGMFLWLITRVPPTWMLFDQLRAEIIHEFAFHDHILDKVVKELKEISVGRTNTTFVGVHVRRTDYVDLLVSEDDSNGTVGDRAYFEKAMDHFRSKYKDALFVVSSDDMLWCRANINASKGDVYFVGHGDVDDPIHDFALLSSCNHSIISVGTYGFFTAYLAGGETVYLSNYMPRNSKFIENVPYELFFLPEWKGISAE